MKDIVLHRRALLGLVGERGVRYALELAKITEAEVTVYHAIDYDALIRYGQKSTAPAPFQPPDQHFLDRYQNALSEFLMDCVVPSVNVREKVGLGTPDTSIVELAKSEGYDLIVMSTHGKTGLRMSLGSVTEKIVQNAPCPVLSIRPQTAEKIPGPSSN